MPDPTDPFAAIDAAAPIPNLVTGEAQTASDPFAYIDSGGAPGDRLAATTRLGLVKDPQRAARVLSMRDRIGMPADFIDRNLDQVEQETARQGFDAGRFRQESPLVADWLAQAPEYAAVSRNDLPRLAAVEKFVADSPDYQFLPNGHIIGPPHTGLADEFATPLDLLRKLQQDENNGVVDEIDRRQRMQALQDRFGASANLVAGMAAIIASTQRAVGIQNDNTQTSAEKIGQASSDLAPGLWGDIQRGTGGVIADMPLMLAGGAFAEAGVALSNLGRLKTALATLGKAEGFARGTIQTAFAVQPLAIREGLDTGQQSGWANGLAAWGIETAIPAAFGATGTEKVIANLAARGVSKQVAAGFVPAALGLIKEAGLEATEESVTELAHALHEAASGINPDALNADQLWRRMAAAGAVGGIAGGGFNLPEAIAHMGAHGHPGAQPARIEAAMAGQALVQQLTAAAGESETAKRYEAGAKSLFQTITANKAPQVYLDREGWDQIAQKAGMDPRAAAIELLAGPSPQAGEIVDQKRAKALSQAALSYDEAARTGSPLSVPTADLAFYLARKKEIADAVAQEVRLDPQAMNVREANDLIRSMEAPTEQPAPGETAPSTPQQDAQAIQDDIEQQLTAAGYEAGAARRSAQQQSSAFRTMAARWNAGKANDDPSRITPRQLWERWGVSINRPLPEVLTKPSRQTADQAIAGMRAKLADARLAKIDAGRVAAQQATDSTLATAAAGDAGAKIIDEAVAKLAAEAKRSGAMTTTDAMRTLGADFGFRPDSTAPMTEAQRQRGNLLAAALRARGASLALLLDDAGAAKANPTATTSKPAKAGPVDEQSVAAAFRLRDLVSEIRAGRGDLAELEQAAALAREVGPRIDSLGLNDQERADIRSAVEFAQEGQTLNQELFAGRRGSITFGKDGEQRRTMVRIFGAADLSTHLHESGHLYLELLTDLATKPGAPADILADTQAVLDWLGIKTVDQIGVEQHEQFARGFEAYLMEGKSPSMEMRSAFARFAAWLSSIYRDIRALAVSLSPEVRGVYDRLLATEDEIATARASLGDDGFQAHAVEMGLSTDQAASIAKADQEATQAAEDRLRAEAMAEITREQQAHWNELLQEVRGEVEAEVNRQPAYVAESVLRRGELPGGAPLPTGMPAAKLDTADVNRRIEQRLGTTEERAAAKKRLTMMHTRTGGISLDEAAPLFGFPSGDAMLSALLGLRPRKELIEAEAQLRMRSRFGDILTDGSIAEKAMEAIHGEKRAEVHMAKVRALATRVGKKVAPVEVMRAAAEQRIAALPAGDVTPHLYLRAEVKAREEVQRHLAKQAWEPALAAKQRELLNHEMYRAAVQARKDIDAALEYARGFDEKKRRETIGKAGGWEWTVTATDGATFTFPSEEDARQAAAKLGTTTWERTSGYLEQIDALRERYSLKKMSRKDAQKRMSLAAWVAQQMAQGIPVNLPPELLDEAHRTPWRRAPVAELLGLRDGLSHLAHLARTKNELSKLQRKRELETLSRHLEATLVRTKPNPKPRPAEDGRGNKTLEKAADIWAAHRKAANLLREMDGWEDGGPFWDALLRPLNEAADSEASMLWAAKQHQDGLWTAWEDAIGKGDWQANEVRDFAGFQGGLTRLGSIMVALNWGNEGNRARLLDGNKVTETQAQAVLDSLSASDWNLVEGVWDHIDSYWSEIKALEQRATGTAPEKVDASPFPTKHGTIKGGYFPIVYNAESAALRIDGDSAEWAKQMAAQAYGRAVTRHGHTQARAFGQGQPLSLDPNAIGRHVSQVVHDLTHREALGDAARILAQDNVAGAIAKHMGKRTLSQLKSWLGDIATNGRPATGAAKMMGWLRRGFSMATMGFRPMTAALQLTGFVNGAQRVGAGRMAYAIRQLFSRPDGYASNFALAKDKSPMMANRLRTQTQDITEVMNSLRRDNFSQSQATVTKYGFWLMQQVQGAVDTATWLAGYAKAQEEGVSEVDARAHADQAVIDTQAGGQLKDLSGVQRDAYGQAFTGAFTYGAMLFNQLHDVVGGARARARSGDTAGAWLQGFSGFMLAAALPAAMTMLMRDLLRGEPPQDRKDGVAKRYGIELLSSIMGTMIGVREISGAFQGFTYQGPAVTKTFAAYIELIGQIAQGDLDKGLLRATNDAVGGTLGLPSGEVWALGTGIAYYLDHPGPDIRPLLFGPPPKR